MNLIGLSGKKHSGKSTVAQYLTRNKHYTEKAFANPLKRGIIEWFGIPDSSLFGSEEDKNTIIPNWGVSGRQLMQVIGTDVCRDYLPTLLPSVYDIWIRRMENDLKESSSDSIVISDCRFKDEIDLIKRLGGIVIRVERPTLTLIDSHSSETQVLETNYTIHNTGTVLELYTQVDSILSGRFSRS